METPHSTIANLPQSVREALAAATGLRLGDEQQFYIVLVNPRDEEHRRSALADIRRIAAQAEKNIAASDMTAHEFEALADEVCGEIRHGRQS
jgi:hypothetical protein